MKSLAFPLVLLMVVFAMLTISQNLYEDDPTRDIYNTTETLFDWNVTYQEQVAVAYYNQTPGEYAGVQSNRMQNIAYKTIDWMGYVSFEIAKSLVEFGFTHPEYDYRFFFNLVKFLLYTLVVVVCLPLVTPVLALLYLTWRGLVKLYRLVHVTFLSR
jgi:hypothetical protein